MIGGSIVSSALEAKMRSVLAFIHGEYQTAAIVLSANCENSNCDAAADSLEDLVANFAAYGVQGMLLDGSAND